MNKLALCSAASALSLLMSGAAFADDNDGWYLRGNAGYGVHTDADITGGITSQVHDDGIQSEGNGAASLGIGYDFGDNWRLELDGDTLWTDFGSISQVPSSFAKLRTDTVMLNAYYDFDNLGKLEPYVGAGLGLVRGDASLVAHDFINNRLLNRTPVCPGDRVAQQGVSCDVSDTDSGFGWQLIAGLGYALSDNLTWDTHYTYMNAPDFDFEGARTNSVTQASTPIEATLSDVAAHTVMTGLRYRFGNSYEAPKAIAPVAPPPKPTYACWDGSMVFNSGQCPAEPAPVVQTQTCWDGSNIPVASTCPARPAPQPSPQVACWDGSLVSDSAFCPATPEPVAVVQQTNLNVCGSSPVAIFDVPLNTTPKQMSRLGTMPEFGDSHGLTPTEFYEKLDGRFRTSAVDKAYLNYLFKSMGYANGWADAQPYMFSEEVLPVGTSGLLGLGKQHHYKYSILPANDRDRQAFRIQSANGSVVHFMKTCGNYMYACE